MTFTVGPGPAQARESYAQARPAVREIIIYQPGPGPGLQVSGPQNIIEACPGPAHALRADPARGPRPGPRRTLIIRYRIKQTLTLPVGPYFAEHKCREPK